MATKSITQRWWDTIRGKKQWGAAANMEGNPSHYGSRYIYPTKDVQPRIRDIIQSNKPGFIARPGRTELKLIGEFINSIDKPFPKYTERRRQRMIVNAGFFSATDEMLTRYACESLLSFTEADLFIACGAVGCEKNICEEYLPSYCTVCCLGAEILEPFANQWTTALQGRKVLVVHPFIDTIKQQYKKRATLFSDPTILPEFELSTIRAVQSSANVKCDFPDWFAALDFMKKQIDSIDFDVALIGAGAYGPFLAHHCKRIGKVGIHIGSFIQLLFGIKGKRWDNENYSNLINENWVLPSKEETPQHAHMVEEGCYW